MKSMSTQMYRCENTGPSRRGLLLRAAGGQELLVDDQQRWGWRGCSFFLDFKKCCRLAASFLSSAIEA